ncbi:NAD-dependent epimerase/dehydratase family protein [Paenibacillus methanolicus]|uniref:2'-hydroxyisoflavone reductase n=1 Tax=Paenibacillus methanolicus TaxID=582686 RepID=A0A5S5C1Y1_9BACL|nr:NAD-dependent epimerase/dehydratase family protein [Paenibacillus methanolicus]TYP72472.1 2'-hydroxyisoflavone reductase [Paenibacillus methanolicus]
MDLLLLGGTKFLGKHIAETALRRGHRVTLFHRGLTNPGLFPDAEHITGDRDGGLDALAGRRWDAVVDTSGYVPRVVRQSARLLAERADHYTFISSVSVYADFSVLDIAEGAPLLSLEDPAEENVAAHYGALKASCEEEVRSAFGERALVIRPGLIVGPDDPTDRFTYWPWRFAQGGDVLVPGSHGRGIQFIDVRDLAEWTLRMTEARAGGDYNATQPAGNVTMDDLVQACRNVASVDSNPIWAEETFLHEHGAAEWTELPLWVSAKMNWPGFMAINVKRAVEAGLSFRPLSDTAMDTLVWCRRLRPEGEWKAGLDAEKERQLLRLLSSGK